MKYKNSKLKLEIEVYEDKSVAIIHGTHGDEVIILTWREFWSLLRLMNDAAKEVKL